MRNQPHIRLLAALLALVLLGVVLDRGSSRAGGGPGDDHHGGFMLQVGAGRTDGISTSGASTAAATPTAVPGGPGELMLSASDFQPDSSQDAYFRYFGHNAIEPASGSPGIGISAPVHLPQGARITQLTISYYDTNPNAAPLLDLYRGISETLELIGALSSAMPDSSFAGGSDVRSVAVGGPAAVVDNSRYSYMLIGGLERDTTDTTQTQRLSGVRVDYTFDTALPLTTR